MKYFKIFLYLIVLCANLIIALVTNNTPDQSLNGFFSYILIGIWIIFTIEFFSKIKKIREFNSTHNNFFLIFGSLCIGTFYAIWGDFTPILNNNLISGNISFNTWILFFSCPYLIYGQFMLLLCLTKYFSIYLFIVIS